MVKRPTARPTPSPSASIEPDSDAAVSADLALDSGRAWLVVAAAFLSTFTTFGVAYSFGAFFDSMATDFGSGKGATALMFSITTAWFFTIGLVSGKVADRVGPRPVLLVGTASLAVGLLATSRVDSIQLGYLTYGLGVGTAVACGYVPMVAAVGGWFERRRAAALGIAVAGIGSGTLVVSPLSATLIDRYGWRSAYVILAVAGTVLLLLASLGASRPPRQARREQVLLGWVIRQRGFVVAYLAMLVATLSLYVPFVFLKSYAVDRGIDAAPAAALVGVIGGSSIVGRLLLGALGNRWGAIRLIQLSVGIMAASFLLWLGAGSSLRMLVAFAVVMGVGYGGFIALAPAIVAVLFGTAGMGGILGALYTSAAIGGLIGPPVAGVMIDRLSYGAAIAMAMGLAGLAAAVLLALPRPGDRRGDEGSTATSSART